MQAPTIGLRMRHRFISMPFETRTNPPFEQTAEAMWRGLLTAPPALHERSQSFDAQLATLLGRMRLPSANRDEWCTSKRPPRQLAMPLLWSWLLA